MTERIQRLTKRLLLTGALRTTILPDYILADDAAMRVLEQSDAKHSPKARSDAWFKALTREQQRAYIKRHPNSRFARLMKGRKSASPKPKNKPLKPPPKGKPPQAGGLAPTRKPRPSSQVKFTSGGKGKPKIAYKKYDPDDPDHQVWPPKHIKPSNLPTKEQFNLDMKQRGLPQAGEARPEQKQQAADNLRSGQTRTGHPVKAYIRERLASTLPSAASGFKKLGTSQKMTKDERDSLLKVSFVALTAVGALATLGVSGNVAAAAFVRNEVKGLFDWWAERHPNKDGETAARVGAVGPDVHLSPNGSDGWLDEWLSALAEHLEGKHNVSRPEVVQRAESRADSGL